MSEQIEKSSNQISSAEQSENIHFLDTFTALARHKKYVVGLPVLFGAIAIVVSLVMKPTFVSSAVIMPPQKQTSGMTAMLGQLGGLAGAATSIAGLKNPNDMYIGMLQSRTIADRLVSRFDLKERYGRELTEDARARLGALSNIVSGKDGLITIEVSDVDPKFAAALANAYVAELSKVMDTLAITEAAQRRVFFEKQLKAAKDQLANAEVALRTMQEDTGMLQLDGQVKGIISNVAQVEGMIASKEVQLKAMQSFATKNNPEFLRVSEELKGLRAQLSKLQRGQRNGAGDLMLPTSGIPEAGVKYVRSLRDVKYYETIFELLAKQFELAKIDEAKESSGIQVLDEAIPAERKSKPRRMMLVLGGIFAGFILGVVLALIADAYSRSRKNEESARRWTEFTNALRNRRV